MGIPERRLGVGLVLTAGLLAVLVTVVAGGPVWLLAFLLVCAPGPAALARWVLDERQRRWIARVRSADVDTHGTIAEIRPTTSRVDGRDVLRIGVTVQLPGGVPYRVWVRDAPPAHLADGLRPDRSLPLMLDPADPERALIDWHTYERELK